MKSQKSLFVLALACGAMTLHSCTKVTTTTTNNSGNNNTNGSIFITADIDGTPTTFNTNATAVSGSEDGETFTSLYGSGKDGASIYITIESAPVSGKTYSDTATNIADRPVLLYTPSGTNPDSYFNDDDDVNSLPSVTITSVSSDAITGTFKGQVVGVIAVGNTNNLPTKTITNGKFSLRYAK